MMLPNITAMNLQIMADTSGAMNIMRGYVNPTMQLLAGLASIVCVLFLVNGGFQYITSRGNPENLENSKKIIKNSLIGLVLVLGAATLTTILSSAYGDPSSTTQAVIPSLEAIEPEDVGNGLVEVLIKAVTGFINTIIQAAAAPFLAALDYFTKETPLMAKNSGVFNLWLAIVGITDILFILVVALIGFHVMSAANFGFDEIEFKHALPRIGLVFVLLNTSIFIIDAIIELSNVLITAISSVSGASSVWETLTTVVGESGGQGAAALLVMLAFMIFSVILLIYYVSRLVVLFLGAVLSPLVIVLYLLPSFRDFSVSAIKTYITTIFVLFVHVVTLMLASTLFAGMSATDGNNQVPNVLMSMVIGLATVITLLKTQGVMMQFSYVSMGARNTRKLGGQFMNGISYVTGKGRSVASAASSRTATAKIARTQSGVEARAMKSGKTQVARYDTKSGSGKVTYAVTPNSKPMVSNMKTGTTVEAPRVTARPKVPTGKEDKS